MKRKMIAASVVALAGLGIFLGGRTANAEQQLSDMQMANIEALTAGEITVVSCRYEKNAVCVIISDGVLLKEYKNKSKDLR